MRVAWRASLALWLGPALARLQANRDPTPDPRGPDPLPCLDFSTAVNNIGFGNVRGLEVSFHLVIGVLNKWSLLPTNAMVIE